jgi:hypothetical protein
MAGKFNALCILTVGHDPEAMRPHQIRKPAGLILFAFYLQDYQLRMMVPEESLFRKNFVGTAAAHLSVKGNAQIFPPSGYQPFPHVLDQQFGSQYPQMVQAGKLSQYRIFFIAWPVAGLHEFFV